MKLTIFGSTGPTGQLVIEKGLAAGHEVTAFARNPNKLTARSDKLRVVSASTR
jgi:putative NADH-flavin reductase